MIKVSELAAQVKEIGKRWPDTDYCDLFQKHYPGKPTNCWYRLGDEPGCIVGQGMYELGLDLDTIHTFDATGGDAIFAVVRDNPDIFVLDDVDSMQYLTDVQRSQDIGCTWGEAIDPQTL